MIENVNVKNCRIGFGRS